MGGITVRIPEPSATQREFLEARCKHVAFGGARGGGKSWAIRVKAILLALRFPGIKQLVIRRTYPELRMNHIGPIRSVLPESVASYNDSHKELTFKNGSVIFFRFCANDGDLLSFQGQECDVLFIDEATQFTENQYRVLKACVRGANSFPKRIYLSCNPGGVGHGWVKRLFVDRRFTGAENGDEYVFIRSRVWDNKALMKYQPDYVTQLQTLDSKHRAAWLDGDWNIFEGVFFEEFRDDPAHYEDRRFTHVIEPFRIPPDWRIYRSFDWGYSRPFSCGWWAVDYEGTAYRILELYGCSGDPNVGVKWTADRVFSEIARIEREHEFLAGKNVYGVADPAIFSSDTGESVEEAASRRGVFFTRGDNSRLPGWMQMRRRLAFDEEGRAKMYIFKNCRAFIRTVPSLVYDENRVEDLDTTGEDHVADETRYFCMARPLPPRANGGVDPFDLSPAATYLDVSRADLPRYVKPDRMQVVSSH